MSLARSPQWPADKAHARNAILEWRKELALTQRAALTEQISSRLQARLAALSQTGGSSLCVGVYWPIRNEPDLRSCFRALSGAGFDLALPITPQSPAPLTFMRWQDGDPMQKDKMGIAIPAIPSSQQPVIPDVLVIPCVGFGPGNIRLGYGGGYYDRTLAEFSGVSIGIAYSPTFLPDLVAQEFDVALDEILTDGHPSP